MSLSTSEISAAAEQLFQAEQNRQQIGLLSKQYPNMDMADAYAVQAALIEKKIQSGRDIRGFKIGLTSKAMQSALNIDIPDSGILFDDMFYADGERIDSQRFIQPRIEVEIAFVLKHDLLAAACTRDAVLEATEYVCPAIEILDTRIVRLDPESGQARRIVDTISDNAANAALVLGQQQHRPCDWDLRWVGAIVSRNEEVEETGLGAGVLNDPVTGVVWLVERLASQGQHLRAGDVILSGSFIRPIEARQGDQFHACYGPFGSVSCEFV